MTRLAGCRNMFYICSQCKRVLGMNLPVAEARFSLSLVFMQHRDVKPIRAACRRLEADAWAMRRGEAGEIW